MRVPSMKTDVGKLKSHSLYRNSSYLMAGEILNPAIGFFFWLLASRFYSADVVGLAVALISAMMLLSMLSKLGLDVGLMRFLPESKNKEDLIHSALSIVLLISLTLGAIFIIGAGLWSPALLFLQNDFLLMIVFIVSIAACSLYTFQDAIAVSLRTTEYVFIKNLINGIAKLILVFGLFLLGLIGLFGSWVAAMLLGSLAFSLFFMRKMMPGYRTRLGFRTAALRDIFSFSAGNYVIENFREFPRNMMPLIVVNLITAESGAYFYIPWTVANVLFMLSYSVSMSLVAECATDEKNTKSHILRALWLMMAVSIIGIVGVLSLGDYVLALFGDDYVTNASAVLKLFAVSSIPVSLNYLFLSHERIYKKNKSILFGYIFITLFTIAFSIATIPTLGINGAALGWLISQSLAAALFGTITLLRSKRAGKSQSTKKK